MASNSKKDNVIAVLILIPMIALVVYQSTIFIPGWAYHLANKSGSAEIKDKYEEEGKKFIEYTYYNEYLRENVINTRKIANIKHWEQYIPHKRFKISYARYFPTLVIFESIDKEPLFLLRVFFYVIELIVIGLVVGVLRDKISLQTLAGVRVEPNEPKK